MIRNTNVQSPADVTTTSPTRFVLEPSKWLFFHDRIRGQRFTRPVPTRLQREKGEVPPALPHRYMKLVAREVASWKGVRRRIAAVKLPERYRP